MKLGYFEKGRFIEFPTTKLKTTEETLYELNNRMDALERNYGNFHFHTDIGFRDATEIIICGVLNGKDYVQKYYIPESETQALLKILRNMQSSMQRGRFDLPRGYGGGLWGKI